MVKMEFSNKYIVFLFIAVIIFIALFLYIPSLFSIDDASYFLMAKSFNDSFSYRISNGYEEYKSTVFGVFQPVYYRNAMYAKYPPYYPIVAFPFYRVLGFQGLFLLNIISFAGALYFIYLIAMKLFDDRLVAARSVYLYALSTFAMEYAIGLWPHMLSVFLVMAGMYLFLSYFLPDKGSFSVLIASSALLSFSIGIRLLNLEFLVVAAMLILFVQRKIIPAIIFILSAVPSLLLQGAINSSRFGIFDPFSYGHYKNRNFSYYLLHPELSIIFIFMAFVIFLVIKKEELFSGKKLLYMSGVFSVALVFLLVVNTEFRNITFFWLYTCYCNIFDISSFHYDLAKDESGGMLFSGIVKKALIQSCPYLILSFLGFIFMLKEGVTKKRTLYTYFLFIIPILFMSSFFFHGGFAFNIRYALELIPFGIISFCWLIRDMRFGKWEITAAGLISSFFLILFYYQKVGNIFFENLILYIPLFLSAVLLLLFVYSKRSVSDKISVRFSYKLLLLISIFYSVCAAWAGDVQASRRIRLNNYSIYNSLNTHIEDNSLICMTSDKTVEILPIKALKNVRIAYIPVNDLLMYETVINSFLVRNIHSYVLSYSGDEKAIKNSFGKKYVLKKIANGDILLYEILSKKPEDKVVTAPSLYQYQSSKTPLLPEES
ncbi:MAG: hypothetical protein HZA77_09045 [Candidatus Schekmanbacteria bacterium]|nr:hypothetical protein [Candidatus Schekmanbacteria bacterium]